jgi:hypothetical protein
MKAILRRKAVLKIKAIRNQIAGRTLLIHNPAPFSIFYHHRQILSLRSVHVDRHRPRALSSGDKNNPLPLVLGKAQKISFPIHLKIHPIPPHKCHPARSCHRRSGRQRSRRILNKSPKGWREGRAASTPWMLRFANHPLRSGRQTDKQLSQPINSEYNPQTAITISKQWREQPCPRHPFKLGARS